MMDTLALRVAERDLLSPTLLRLRLTSANANRLPSVTPGSHLVLDLPVKDGARRNAYSITQAGKGGTFYEIIVRHSPTSRGGSAFVHKELTVDSILNASCPSNFLALESTAKKILLIGGGVGVTPLLALARARMERGETLEFHQFCTPEEKPVFESLLAPFGQGVACVHAGRNALDFQTLFRRQPLGTYIYTCGPNAMMERVLTEATAMGWPERRIHQESFGAGGGNPFTVTLARTGGTIPVAEDQTLLDALESADVPITSLCRGGACGMCRTPVLAGTPEHRDHFLSADEKASGRWIMPCVSRAHGACLTLDL